MDDRVDLDRVASLARAAKNAREAFDAEVGPDVVIALAERAKEAEADLGRYRAMWASALRVLQWNGVGSIDDAMLKRLVNDRELSALLAEEMGACDLTDRVAAAIRARK